MPFLLMVFLTLVCVPEVETWPGARWTSSPWWAVAATWLAVAVTVLYARRVAGFALRAARWQGGADRRDRLLHRYERGRFYHQIALFGIFLLGLYLLGWGWAVAQLWQRGGGYLPGLELVLLAPFVVGQLLAWAVFYDAEKASHRPFRLASAEGHMACELHPNGSASGAAPDLAVAELSSSDSGEIVLAARRSRDEGAGRQRSFGSRGSYVLFQARQKLALVFLPVLLLIVQKEVHRLFPQAWREWQGAVNLAGVVALLAVFAGMPWIMRLVLGLRPLPPGPLRDRLMASARRLRFRCSNLLLWNTRSGMANAMVVGILPWPRYVVFTDRLIEDFQPEEVEAVLGHEVGHIRHHHMIYYLGFLAGSVVVLGLVVDRFLPALFELLASGLARIIPAAAPYLEDLLDPNGHEYLAALHMVALLLGYIFVVFGFLSRRCERQADVFGCRAVSCLQTDCPGHEEGAALPERGHGLCPTGIRTFIRALEKVALVNGISRDKPGFLQSWQHSTIARRVEFLQGLLADPAAEPRFQRRVALVKWALLVLLVGTFALLVGGTDWHF
jgi:STE24 endopeptidase